MKIRNEKSIKKINYIRGLPIFNGGERGKLNVASFRFTKSYKTTLYMRQTQFYNLNLSHAVFLYTIKTQVY